MAIFKRFKHDFTQVPNKIINNKDLSLKAKGLWLYIASKPEEWDYSVKGTSSQSKDGIDSVTSGTKELEKMGYLYREARKNKMGQWDGYDYHLFDEPDKEIAIDGNAINGKSFNGEPPNHSNKELSNTITSNTKEDLQNSDFATSKNNESEKDLFGEKPNKNKKTIFKNSPAADFSVFENSLLDEKKLGIDLFYYYNSIKDWGEIKLVKRTFNGWIATARTFMRKDNESKKLKMIVNQSNPPSNDDMMDYLNMSE